MDLNNTKQIEINESGAIMGFEISDDLKKEVIGMIRADFDQDNARLIPDSDGLVLVKNGSKAFEERKDNGVIMIPFVAHGLIGGIPTDLTYFICTK